MLTKTWLVCYILFMLAIVTLGCESRRRTASQNQQFKSIYLNQFKLTYFRKLLAKSYNNSSAVQEVIAADHSGFTEQILTADDYHLIDSLTTIDNEYLKIDSAEGNRRAEGAQGKRPLGFIMQKLTGKWLDSLARQRLKRNGADTWSE